MKENPDKKKQYKDSQSEVTLKLSKGRRFENGSTGLMVSRTKWGELLSQIFLLRSHEPEVPFFLLFS